MIKGVKPRTHLLIDLIQFTLLVILACTALVGELTENRWGQTHGWFMVHVAHVAAGAALCLTVGLHLLLHWPWIRIQAGRLLRSQP